MFTVIPVKSVVRAEYGSIINSNRIKTNFGGDNRITVFMSPRMPSENMSQPEGTFVICQLTILATVKAHLTVCPH